MRLIHWSLILPLVCASLGAQADCQSLAKAIQDASRAGDLATLEQLADKIPTEPTCADAYRGRLAQVAAFGFLREIQHRLGGGESLADQQALIEQSLRIDRTWQALAMLGDLDQERKNYAQATLAYQEALNLINDPALTRQAPPPEDIQSIHQKASECQLLADNYVKPPQNHRSGEAGGLGLTSVRGWAVKRVPVPVTFQANTAEFTTKGLDAAQDLAVTLERDKPPRITLIGHTDERGSDQANLFLSKRRAEAVAAYLRKQGYAGEIRVEGAGESRPTRVSDPSRYSQEEIWALNRRVELERN